MAQPQPMVPHDEALRAAGPRPRRHRWHAALRRAALACVAAGLVAGACGHDWDTYDPRLSGGAGAAGGGQGGGQGGDAQGGGGPGGGGQGGAGGTFVSTGEHLCSAAFGDASAQSVHSVAVDPNGDVVMTGFFYGGIDFGGGAIASAGEADGFLAKLDAQCNYRFAIGFGGAASDNGWGVATDGLGNIALTGTFRGDVVFGGDALSGAGGAEVYVSKLDGDGNFLWSRGFGDAQNQWGNQVAFDAAGNLVAVGSFNGIVNLGGGDLASLGDDLFVAKLDPQGDHVWSRRIGGPGWESFRRLAVDALGNVLITGGFSGSMDLGGQTLTSGGNRDVFVTKLDPAGNVVWAQQFFSPEPTGQDYARTIGVDAAGNLVVAGRFEASLDLGQGRTPLEAAGGRDIFVVKLAPDGALLWGQRFGGPGDDNVRDMVVDPSGAITLVGGFYTTIDFGGATLESAGDSDVFIARLDADGGHVWSRRTGDATYQVATAAALSAAGNAVIVGDFGGVVDLGGSAFTSAGDSDLFMVLLGP